MFRLVLSPPPRHRGRRKCSQRSPGALPTARPPCPELSRHYAPRRQTGALGPPVPPTTAHHSHAKPTVVQGAPVPRQPPTAEITSPHPTHPLAAARLRAARPLSSAGCRCYRCCQCFVPVTRPLAAHIYLCAPPHSPACAMERRQALSTPPHRPPLPATLSRDRQDLIPTPHPPWRDRTDHRRHS